MKIANIEAYVEFICGFCGHELRPVPQSYLANSSTYKTRCTSCYRGLTYKIADSVPVDCVVETIGDMQWVPGLALVQVAGTKTRFLCETGFHARDPNLRARLEDYHNKQFYINENSVLTNTIPVVEIYSEDHSDPSGSIEFLALFGPGDTECVPNVNKLPIADIDITHDLVEDEDECIRSRSDILYFHYRKLEQLTEELRTKLLNHSEGAELEFQRECENHADSVLFWWLMADYANCETKHRLSYNGHAWCLVLDASDKAVTLTPLGIKTLIN